MNLEHEHEAILVSQHLTECYTNMKSKQASWTCLFCNFNLDLKLQVQVQAEANVYHFLMTESDKCIDKPIETIQTTTTTKTNVRACPELLYINWSCCH